jgi:hypothetical protein
VAATRRNGTGQRNRWQESWQFHTFAYCVQRNMNLQ